MNETLFGRCLACWSGSWASVDVQRVYPQTFDHVCPLCKALRTFAISGRLQPLRTRGALVHLHGSVKRHVKPDWTQLDLPSPDLAGAYDTALIEPAYGHEQADDHTPTPAESRIRNGSGSTRPRQSPAT